MGNGSVEGSDDETDVAPEFADVLNKSLVELRTSAEGMQMLEQLTNTKRRRWFRWLRLGAGRKRSSGRGPWAAAQGTDMEAREAQLLQPRQRRTLLQGLCCVRPR